LFKYPVTTDQNFTRTYSTHITKEDKTEEKHTVNSSKKALKEKNEENKNDLIYE